MSLKASKAWSYLSYKSHANFSYKSFKWQSSLVATCFSMLCTILAFLQNFSDYVASAGYTFFFERSIYLFSLSTLITIIVSFFPIFKYLLISFTLFFVTSVDKMRPSMFSYSKSTTYAPFSCTLVIYVYKHVIRLDLKTYNNKVVFLWEIFSIESALEFFIEDVIFLFIIFHFFYMLFVFCSFNHI